MEGTELGGIDSRSSCFGPSAPGQSQPGPPCGDQPRRAITVSVEPAEVRGQSQACNIQPRAQPLSPPTFVTVPPDWAQRAGTPHCWTRQLSTRAQCLVFSRRLINAG